MIAIIRSGSEYAKKLEPSYIVHGNAKLCNPIGKTAWQFLERLNIE
jgi:hypothetical protein